MLRPRWESWWGFKGKWNANRCYQTTLGFMVEEIELRVVRISFLSRSILGNQRPSSCALNIESAHVFPFSHRVFFRHAETLCTYPWQSRAQSGILTVRVVLPWLDLAKFRRWRGEKLSLPFYCVTLENIPIVVADKGSLALHLPIEHFFGRNRPRKRHISLS